MKFSKETINQLKNFATINSNILLKAGTNKLSTISAQKNVMASATIAESISDDFGIYDLNEFLAAISLFSDPDLSFNDKFVTIKEGSHNVKFFSAAANVLTVPTKEINFPTPEIELNLSAKALEFIQRTASVLRAPDLSIVGDGTSITAVVGDKKNPSANTTVVDGLGSTTSTFQANIKIENLKLVPGDYKLAISSKRISRFQGAGDLVYYIAVETDSTFQ